VDLPIAISMIDAGYNTPTVYQFCDQYASGVLPLMGDHRIGTQSKTFLLKKITGYSVRRADIYTDILKQEIYTNLGKLKSPKADTYPPGYCHFPADYDEKYF